MIKLYSKRLLISRLEGGKQPFDAERLQHDLQLSFAAVGVQENWLAEHLIIAVEDQLAEQSALLGTEQSEEDIERLLIKILKDTGYPDVAADFAKRRGKSGSEAVNLKRLPWTQQRIRQLLQHELDMSPNGTALLAEAVLGKLAALQMPLVSDKLILQIAEHILAELASEQRQNTDEQQTGGWLMPAGYWSAFFAGDTASLLAAGVLQVHPVSSLFPVVRVSVDSKQLADSLGGTTLTELEFVPAFRNCVRHALRALTALQEHALTVCEVQGRPAYLQVHGLAAVVRAHLGKRRKADAERLTGELVDMIRECANGKSEHVIISVL
jgi:hypothetical protein